MIGSSPSQRFRLEQWIPALERDGIRVDWKPFADAWLMRILHMPSRAAEKAAALFLALVRRAIVSTTLGGYDAVIVHRAAALFGPALLERLIASRRPVIFDFDDAIFLTHTTAANRRFGWLKFSGKTRALCRISTHVTVGNAYLAAYAQRHNPHVTIVPSSVDTDRYCPGPRRAAGPLVVGWMGSSTSQTHLEMFAPVLRKLVARRPVEIHVVSDRAPRLDGLPVSWRPWSSEREVDELRTFDIGIMPMPDDAWAEGKCAMKALLYMAAGVPVICSAVGMNRELIRHGENGFLATTDAEWFEAFDALGTAPELRARIGDAGRDTVVKGYSTEVCATRFAGVVQQVLRQGHR